MVKVIFDLNIPEGWEATGEYRVPNKGDFILKLGEVHSTPSNGWGGNEYPIVREAPQPGVGQVWEQQGREYLLVKLPSGCFQALSLMGEGGFWLYPDARASEAVKGLTFKRKSN